MGYSPWVAKESDPTERLTHIHYFPACLCLVLRSCPTRCDPWTVAHRALCLWDFSEKNTGAGCHFLFPNQRSNLYLLCLCIVADSLLAKPAGKPHCFPRDTKENDYPLSGWKQQKFFFACSPGGQKSKMKVPVGLCAH